MVIYEAASAIVSLHCTTTKELASAVSVLQLLCSSPRPSLRYAAVKTLNKISISHPAAVTACNLDLENLITDQNRSIATLAITTLLKTGNESSVDRLMKQISSFMSEISDEFKIVVVEAIQSLCLKFPRKHTVMMNFLASMLRDDGGYEYGEDHDNCGGNQGYPLHIQPSHSGECRGEGSGGECAGQVRRQLGRSSRVRPRSPQSNHAWRGRWGQRPRLVLPRDSKSAWQSARLRLYSQYAQLFTG